MGWLLSKEFGRCLYRRRSEVGIVRGRIVIVTVVGIVAREWLIDKARGWLSGKNKRSAGIEPQPARKKLI